MIFEEGLRSARYKEGFLVERDFDQRGPYVLIHLGQGRSLYLDEADWSWAKAFPGWFAKRGRKTFYCVRSSLLSEGVPRRTIRLHRELLKASDADFVDHADGNGLNCRRYNIRICTQTDNARNSSHAVGASGYRGVRRHGGRWKAEISVNDRTVHIGSFVDIEIAARAYDAAARHHFGEFAVLNFGDANA